MNHDRTKHMNAKYYSIREVIAEGKIQSIIASRKTMLQTTKDLSGAQLEILMSEFGISKKTFQEKVLKLLNIFFKETNIVN